MIAKPFEQVEVGERQVTRARTITETDIVNFAMLTGDWHSLHTDVEHAKKSAYGERIAHGMLVLSVMTGLVMLDAGHVLAFYGMDRVRFVRPTKIGDTIHAVTEVTETRERDERSGIVTLDVSIDNQHDETVASATVLMVVAREASAQTSVPPHDAPASTHHALAPSAGSSRATAMAPERTSSGSVEAGRGNSK